MYLFVVVVVEVVVVVVVIQAMKKCWQQRGREKKGYK